MLDIKYKFTTVPQMTAEETRSRSDKLARILSELMESSGIATSEEIAAICAKNGESCSTDHDKKSASKKLPLIVAINGPATAGKGAFISGVKKFSTKAVHELSEIDPVRSAVETLIYKHDGITDYMEDPTGCIWSKSAIQEKGDTYRTFLHEVKMIWEKLYCGATVYGVTATLDTIGRYLNQCSVIFINMREAECLNRFTEQMYKLGLICITMLVDRENEVTRSWTNEGDKKVFDYSYGVTINNDGTVWDLENTAMRFARYVDFLIPDFCNAYASKPDICSASVTSTGTVTATSHSS